MSNQTERCDYASLGCNARDENGDCLIHTWEDGTHGKFTSEQPVHDSSDAPRPKFSEQPESGERDCPNCEVTKAFHDVAVAERNHERHRALKAEAELASLKQQPATPALEAVRPAVIEMAKQMEVVLRDNDHKGGWHNMDYSDILFRIDDEVKELHEAYDNDYGGGIIKREAVDVANFCMMLVDLIISTNPRKFTSKTQALTAAPAEPVRHLHDNWCGVCKAEPATNDSEGE